MIPLLQRFPSASLFGKPSRYPTRVHSCLKGTGRIPDKIFDCVGTRLAVPFFLLLLFLLLLLLWLSELGVLTNPALVLVLVAGMLWQPQRVVVPQRNNTVLTVRRPHPPAGSPPRPPPPPSSLKIQVWGVMEETGGGGDVDDGAFR